MENKIILNNASFFKNLLFCACRYCIGRHTAMTICMANDIAKNVFEYLDFNDRQFLAYDIRRHINDVLRRKSNIKIYDYRFNVTMDALTRIVECIEEVGLGNREEGFQIDDYFFKVNETDVTIEPGNNSFLTSYNESFITCYTDLLPWIKLANALDNDSHYIVEYELNGELKSEICFPIPTISSDLKNISIKYMPLKTYLDRSWVESWIQEDLIKNVHLLNHSTI